MKQANDQTLFAWHFGYEVTEDGICGLLATTPSTLANPRIYCRFRIWILRLPFNHNQGLKIELPIVQQRGLHALAILQCSTTALFPNRVALPIVRTTQQDSNQYARDRRHFDPLDFVKPGSCCKGFTKNSFHETGSGTGR
jgi:hypothetical protein